MKKTSIFFLAIFIQFIGYGNICRVFSLSPEKEGCETIAENSNTQDVVKKNLENVKNCYQDLQTTLGSINKTLDDATKTSIPAHLIAKITHNSTNLANTMNKIAQSKYLTRIDETGIPKLFCKSSNFMNKFSKNLIADPKGKPVKDFLKELITSDWVKEGMADIDHGIKTLVKHVDRDESEISILSYLPNIKTNYREFSDTICRMLKAEGEVFTSDIVDLIQYSKNFEKIINEIASNPYLVEHGEIEKIKPINTTIKKLQGYFTSLSEKLIGTKEELNPVIECSEIQSDIFAQEIMHIIFIYKHNKLDYKQMNSEINKLIRMMKDLQVQKNNYNYVE